MDSLHDIREQLEAGVFRQVANLLNLEVDLLTSDELVHHLRGRSPDADAEAHHHDM